MILEPLTPAEAVAIAAVIEAHPNRLPHWMRWVKKLRQWASEQTTAAATRAEIEAVHGA